MTARMIGSSLLGRIDRMKAEPRNITMKFYVSERERDLIQQRMKLIGIINQSAFLRKQAIDGYIIRLETPELIDLVRVSRHYCDLLNSIARRVNETSRFYDADMKEIRAMSKDIQDRTQDIFMKLLNLE